LTGTSSLRERFIRRIHQWYFREIFPNGISALGYSWDLGQDRVLLRLKSLPGDHPKTPSRPILYPTANVFSTSHNEQAQYRRGEPDALTWPLQDIRSRHSFDALVHHHRIPSPSALLTLSQYYCTTDAQYTTPHPTLPVYAIHHTPLTMAISCEGQALTDTPKSGGHTGTSRPTGDTDRHKGGATALTQAGSGMRMTSLGHPPFEACSFED